MSGPITDEEFNAEMNGRGALAHNMPMFMVTRLALCLRAVLEATGEPGAEAFREYCRQRKERDNQGG